MILHKLLKQQLNVLKLQPQLRINRIRIIRILPFLKVLKSRRQVKLQSNRDHFQQIDALLRGDKPIIIGKFIEFLVEYVRILE